MYIPRHTKITDKTIMHRFMQRFSFATLVSVENGIPIATHLPFIIDPDSGENGKLIAHMARANSQWKTFDQDVLVIFQGDHAYISPSWYAELDVPTWNYMTVHAYGKPVILEDWTQITAELGRLVDQHERHFDPSWKMDLPEDFLEMNLKALVAFEIPITRLEGKFKLSQNRSLEDQRRVVEALLQSNDSLEQGIGREMLMAIDTH